MSRAKQSFTIPAGPLDAALKTWSRQSGRSILFRPEELASVHTNGISGRLSADAALDALLVGTPCTRVDDPSGAIAIVAQASKSTADAGQVDNGGNATPDILVTGRTGWSLNTGIERTQNDSQPFIVMTREEIQRSGAPNLETFLRDRLNVNTTPGVSEQAKAGASQTSPRGISLINLRGLGARDTLILVDGRRQPGVNVGDGTLTQPSITGIPLAAIERVEVLASSASGIYGNGASGGVINIVLKRDFSGGEVAVNYNDTTDFAQGNGSVDLTYGMPIEGGRTRLSFVGNWNKARPLLFGDRESIGRDAIAKMIRNDPRAFEGRLAPVGTQPNFTTYYAEPLTLKPEFGGTALGTSFGTIPAGYRGLALDGVAPLINAVGTFNFDAPDSAASGGRRSRLLYGWERMSAGVTARREFNTILSGYAGVNWSRSDSTDLRSRLPAYIYLDGDAPNNPFGQRLTIALPGIGEVADVASRQETTSFLGGVIAKLPGGWQAALDLSYAIGRYSGDASPAYLSAATAAELAIGTQDVLRDTTQFPLSLAYDNVPFYFKSTPGRSYAFSPSLRVAGPLPLSFPGGKPQMTINVEYLDDRIAAVQTALSTMRGSGVTYVPSASQQTASIYGEIAFPLIGEKNHIPLVRQLEMRLSARGERYIGRGADPYTCDDIDGPLPADDPFSACRPSEDVLQRSTTRNQHIDPSVSLRWMPFDGITFRGSYSTGYLPPTLAQLVRTSIDQVAVSLRDPLRGGEVIGAAIGSFGQVSGFIGGNPNVRPESSRTFSAGTILTPAFLPGARLSVDWTRIHKRDVYFNPIALAFGGANGQAAFALFLAANPDRAIRAAPSDGFPAGKITSLDLSLVNLLGVKTEAIDFVGEYHGSLLGGTVDLISRGTFVQSLKVESFPGAPAIDFAGVVSQTFALALGSNGALRWRGNLAVNWTRNALTLGWQTRFFDRYALKEDRSVFPGQGSPYVPSQMYHDASISYRFDFGSTLRFGINNIFNKVPPLDATADPLYYSAYGDPRLRNFYLGISKSF